MVPKLFFFFACDLLEKNQHLFGASCHFTDIYKLLVVSPLISPLKRLTRVLREFKAQGGQIIYFTYFARKASIREKQGKLMQIYETQLSSLISFPMNHLLTLRYSL